MACTHTQACCNIHILHMALAGAVYTTRQNIRVPLSTLGAMQTDLHFTLPYHPAEKFPFGNPLMGQLDLASSHFLCQCARLVYEEAAIIQDVVTTRHACCIPYQSALLLAPHRLNKFKTGICASGASICGSAGNCAASSCHA